MRDVGRERRVAAFVRHGQAAVDPDPGRVVDGAEAQDHAVTAGLEFEVALVPAGLVEAAVGYAAGLGLRRIGHRDLHRPAFDLGGNGEGAFVVEAEAP